MKTIQLSNGVELPLLGYGVFMVPPEEGITPTIIGYGKRIDYPTL